MVMVIVVVFLFLVVIFTFFIYLYARIYWRSRDARARRLETLFASTTGDAPATNRGLDSAVLRSLPVTVYKQGLECAVCLTELAAGEEARILPKCSHGFHVQCIDMWFHSHSTCPLCRCSVGPASGRAGEEQRSPEPSPTLPANVLFWGNQEQINASVYSERTLVISIPSRPANGFGSTVSPLPSSRSAVEVVIKSLEADDRSPAASRRNSCRMPVSRGRTGGSSCSSPTMAGEIQQGMVGFGGGNGEGSLKSSSLV
ncbi:RING-H2 finger protein ATL3 [Apostasia shenzhenica]|uniref:RING-type E3 ubiquitin transferase n=1 Tax=Apostasia shenzhenica TaxID=1088818 RepID=A0A2I0A204_9ASPA|nr:RING-H2 finger protein ATL3 [Apostasia shenzhenica]